MGEPAGIGPEIIVKAWARRAEGVPRFIVFGFPELLRREGEKFGVPIIPVPSSAAALDAWAGGLPVFSGLPFGGNVAPGRPDSSYARFVILCLDRALASVTEGSAAAMVTAPIQKATLTAAGFSYPGHTEYLAAKTGAQEPLMLLVGGGLRVALATIHVPLKDVPELLTPALIVRKCAALADGLRTDFGMAHPRVAVAALNPHAGEAGTIGREEIEIIAPAVRALGERGIDANGPFPADTLFHEQARARYDAVFCMYHDQALIPLKTLDFRGGVNVTLGLPIVRTSPDHGTALDIAGKGIADPTSFIAALKMAAGIAERRASPA